MRWGLAAPNEFAVFVAFCQYAYKAWLAIECPTDVGWVTPVLRHVVETAMHIRSAGRCPVRWWSRLTLVMVLLGSS